MEKLKMYKVIWGMVLLLQACGGGGDGKPVIEKQKEEFSEQLETMTSSDLPGFEKLKSVAHMEALKMMTPATREELRTWLPERVFEFTRIGFSIGNQAMAGVSSIMGSFSDESKNKQFELTVIDGAGEAGGVFTFVYFGQFIRDFEVIHHDGFSKSINKGNARVIVSQNNLLKTAELECVEGDRYYVKFSGVNMDVQELWEVAESLQLQNLPGL